MTSVNGETPFNAKEWVGTFIHLAQQNAQAIPDDIIQQLPAQFGTKH